MSMGEEMILSKHFPDNQNTSITTPSAYRAALALNNMAITMVERCCYGQAYRTFKDAAFAMKVASQTLRKGTPDEKHSVCRMVRQANHRAANPKLSVFYVDVNVVSHDGTVNPEEIIRADPSSHTVKLIRIEPSDGDLVESDKSDLATAIVLYNFSTVYLWQSWHADNAERAFKLHAGAVKLLKMSSNILGMLYEACDDTYIIPHVVFSLTILFRTLVQALHAHTQEADEYVAALAHLHEVARLFDFYHQVTDFQQAAPAA